MPLTRDPLVELTASDVVEAIRAGDISAEQYAEALLTETEVSSELNAFIALDPDAVISAARRADRTRACLLYTSPSPRD